MFGGRLKIKMRIFHCFSTTHLYGYVLANISPNTYIDKVCTSFILITPTNLNGITPCIILFANEPFKSKCLDLKFRIYLYLKNTKMLRNGHNFTTYNGIKIRIISIIIIWKVFYANWMWVWEVKMNKYG